MIFVCGCCGESYPTLHRHIHHKIPRAVGGPDTPDNLISLCPGCHDAIHSIATKLLSKKTSPGRIQDQIELIYKDNIHAQKMCLMLAQKIRDALVITREKGLDPDHLVPIATVLRKEDKDYLTLFCREHAISQDDLLRSLVLQTVGKWLGHTNDQIAEKMQAVKMLKRQKKGAE